MRKLIGCALALALPMTSAAAHHSFAMFDNTRSITLRGTVAKFQWTNPHAYLQVDADDGSGGTKHYTLEMTSINMMSRGGWTSRTIKAGDQVTVYVSPLRNGTPGGLVLEVVLPSGKHMLPGVPNVHRYARTSD